MGKATRLAQRRYAAERLRAVRDEALACARQYAAQEPWRCQWVRIARWFHRRMLRAKALPV